MVRWIKAHSHQLHAEEHLYLSGNAILLSITQRTKSSLNEPVEQKIL